MSTDESRRSRLLMDTWETFIEVPVLLQALFWALFFALGLGLGLAL